MVADDDLIMDACVINTVFEVSSPNSRSSQQQYCTAQAAVITSPDPHTSTLRPCRQ